MGVHLAACGGLADKMYQIFPLLWTIIIHFFHSFYHWNSFAAHFAYLKDNNLLRFCANLQPSFINLLVYCENQPNHTFEVYTDPYTSFL